MRPSSAKLLWLGAVACAIALAQSPRIASGASEAGVSASGPTGELPESVQDLRIVEKIGRSVLDDAGVAGARFRDTEGKQVALADFLDGGLPVILTFNYSSCPMLCSAQLNALVDAMGKIPFAAGEQYRIVTIGLSPRETPDEARATRDRYIAALPEERREAARRGWHFLTGDEAAIKTVAGSVGVRYRYLDDIGEYAHPAALIFLSPTGVVTRYYHGAHYEPGELGTSIFKAGAGEHGVSVGFLLACFRIGTHQSYAKMGETVMRYGAIGFVALLLAAFAIWQWARSRHARAQQES